VKPQCFARRNGIEARDVDDETFLITRSSIEHLNPPAACIWRALERPRGRSELYVILRATYPAVSHQRLTADLNALLRVLEKRRLIRRLKA
jgi:hypothetical protein